MKIELYNNDIMIDLDNVMYKDYNEETQYRKVLFSKYDLDFSPIHLLKGEKTLMELSFQETKKELI